MNSHEALMEQWQEMFSATHSFCHECNETTLSDFDYTSENRESRCVECGCHKED